MSEASPKVCGTLTFESHDDLIVAYANRLSKGWARLKASKPVPAGQTVAIKVAVTNTGASLKILATTELPKSSSDGDLIVLRFLAESCAELERFVLEHDPAVATMRPEPQHRILKVLVVDDDDLQRRATAAPFEQRGDTVLCAEDGLNGLAVAVEHEPDVILSDVQMPKVDGWQMLRMLRARPRLQTTPIIFLTTLSNEESRLRGYRLGVDDYLEKPFVPEILLAKVERVVRRAKVGAHSWVPAASDALRGDLEQVGLPSLLSFLELERKSGTVYLEPRGTRVVIDGGRPIRARSARRDSAECGAAALFDVLALKSGRFEFVPGATEEDDSIGMSLGAALLEHARLEDEAQAS